MNILFNILKLKSCNIYNSFNFIFFKIDFFNRGTNIQFVMSVAIVFYKCFIRAN